ncbi:MAG: hypothetical protein QXF95_08335, partial [Candidatus Caldarchaeum sp.]
SLLPRIGLTSRLIQDYLYALNLCMLEPLLSKSLKTSSNSKSHAKKEFIPENTRGFRTFQAAEQSTEHTIAGNKTNHSQTDSS